MPRFVRNDRLTDALMAQAFTALSVSPGARALYDGERARGTGHNPALRKVANRLVGILHGCRKHARRLTFKLLGCLSCPHPAAAIKPAENPCQKSLNIEASFGSGLAAKRTGIRSLSVMAIRRGFVIVTCPLSGLRGLPSGWARADYGRLSMIWMSSSRR